MKARALIDARLSGTPLERIVEAVQAGRQTVSSLPQDTSDFFESMIPQVEKAVKTLRMAILSEDLASIRCTAESLQEIFQMMGDAANDRS